MVVIVVAVVANVVNVVRSPEESLNLSRLESGRRSKAYRMLFKGYSLALLFSIKLSSGSV